IDINGGITIGPDTDWSVNLPASMMNPVRIGAFGNITGGGEIAIADYLYERKRVSNPIFNLGTTTASAGDSRIGVQYDAQNKRIILNNVRASSDGGSLVLDGGILSTNPLGNIQVNGGLGDVEANNQTGRTLVVQNVYAGNAGPAQSVLSTVDITDHFLPAGSNHWVYQYTPQSGVSVYNGAAGSSVEAGNMSLKPASASYTPVSGLRWAWEQVAAMHNALPPMADASRPSLEAWGNYLVCCNWSWNMPAGQPNNPWQYVTASGALSNTPEGRAVIDPDSRVFKRALTARIKGTYDFVQSGGSQNFFYTGPEFNSHPATLFFPKDVELRSSASVKADNPIGIHFFGSAQGRVAINSNAPVVLGGDITNPGGATTITSGAGVSQGKDASILTDSLLISAVAGIGGKLQPVVAHMSGTGNVTALGGEQGVYLDLQGGRIAAVQSRNAAGTQYGDVMIRSLDDLLPVTGGTGAIVGANVALSSTLGSVGSQAAPVRLSAMGAGGQGGVVDVTAVHDINLVDSAPHDFLAGRIESVAGGDVSISVPNGAILNARGQTAAQALSKEQVTKVWEDLNLTKDFGAEEEGSRTAHSVIAFENLASRQYQVYHQLAASGDTSSPRYTEALTWLDQNVGGNWKTGPYNPAFSYRATAAQVADLTRNAVWTEAELSNSINRAALQSASGAPVGIGEPNIIGNRVTLSSGTGIGKLSNPVEVTLEAIRANTLSDEQSAALALANTPGDIVSLAKDAQGNIVTYTIDALPAGATPYGFRIAQTAPLFVDASGSLEVTTGGAAFVQSVRPDLALDRVQANGAVSLIAPRSIAASTTRLQPALPLITSGGDLRLAAGSGSLGTLADALTLQVGGKLASASAAQDLYLNVAGDLNFDRVFAGEQAVLTATGSLLSGSDSSLVNARGLDLQAGGDIGSTARAVAVQVSGNDSLSASAGGSVYLHGTGPGLNVANLSSGQGMEIFSQGELRVGQIHSNGAASLKAGGFLVALDGHDGVNVTAQGISLISDTSDIGRADRRLVIEDHGTTTASAFGSIYLEQRNAAFNADALTGLTGSVDLLVSHGNATIGKLTARDAANVVLASGGRLLIEDLDPESSNLAVNGAGGSISLLRAAVSGRLDASAANISIRDLSQVGGSGPLHLALQGPGGAMADTIDLHVSSANGVTVERLTARNADIGANAVNLWIENARIGSFGKFSSAYYTAYLDNVS
ncbi:MAG: hypothetical protein ACKVQA_18325, partial [Burkholderiales bacterium]